MFELVDEAVQVFGPLFGGLASFGVGDGFTQSVNDVLGAGFVVGPLDLIWCEGDGVVRGLFPSRCWEM